MAVSHTRVLNRAKGDFSAKQGSAGAQRGREWVREPGVYCRGQAGHRARSHTASPINTGGARWPTTVARARIVVAVRPVCAAARGPVCAAADTPPPLDGPREPLGFPLGRCQGQPIRGQVERGDRLTTDPREEDPRRLGMGRERRERLLVLGVRRGRCLEAGPVRPQDGEAVAADLRAEGRDLAHGAAAQKRNNPHRRASSAAPLGPRDYSG